MKSLKNEPGTTSNTQPIGPVFPYNFGDEESEHGDEYSAPSRDSERTLYYPDLYVLTNEEHWTMTPATPQYAAAAGSFCFSITEDGEQQDVCNLITMPSVQRSLYLNEATNGHEGIKTEVPDGVDGQTRDMFGTLCVYLRKSCRYKIQNEMSCAKGSISPRSSRILQTIC